MEDAYTTLRVKKTTRDLMKKIASNKRLSVDELLIMFTKTTKDTIKQILLEMDKERYYTMRDIANILYTMKLTNAPKVEDAVLLAIDNLIKGMEKSMQSAQVPHSVAQYDSSTAYQGQ